MELTFVTTKFLNDRSVHLVEELLVARLFVFKIVILITSFFGLNHKDFTVALVMEDKLFDNIISFEMSFFI